MVIATKNLGQVAIDPKNIVRFPEGLYGFEEMRSFVFLKDNSPRNQSPFFWLQCVDGTDPCFVVFDPKAVFADYEPEITPRMLQRVGLSSLEGLRLVVIAHVPADYSKITVNLRCPILVNSSENVGCQVILESDRYSMRRPLFVRKEG